MTTLYATFRDGYTAPVTIKGDYGYPGRPIHIGITQHQTVKRIVFFHLDKPYPTVAHDPYGKCFEPVEIKEQASEPHKFPRVMAHISRDFSLDSSTPNGHNARLPDDNKERS